MNFRSVHAADIAEPKYFIKRRGNPSQHLACQRRTRRKTKICKSEATSPRDITMEALANKIVHNDNVYGLISVDAGIDELNGGRANTLGFHWLDMTEVVLAAVIIGALVWFVRRCYKKKKAEQARNNETTKIEEISRRATENAKRKLHEQTVVKITKLEQMFNNQVVPMLQNQMTPTRNKQRSSG